MGFFSDDEKTFTNLSFNDLFPKDYSVTAAKQSIYFTMDGIGDYNSKFFSFKKMYRPRIKDSWMISRGFNPSSELRIDTVDNNKLLRYIQNTYDKNAGSISTYDISNGWIRDQAEFWLEKHGYDWSSKRKELKIKSKDEEGNEITTTYTRMDVDYKNKSNDPEVPDDINVIHTVFTVVDDSSIEPYIIDIPNEFKTDTIYVEYYRNTNSSDPIKVREEYYHFIVKREGHDWLFDSRDLVITPIVPLKEEGNFRICGKPSGKKVPYVTLQDQSNMELVKKELCQDNDSYKTIIQLPPDQENSSNADAIKRRIKKDICQRGEECGKSAVTDYLNKYGIEPKEIIDALDEKDDDGEEIVDNAYIMTGLKILDPYDIEPGTYKSSEVQNYPPKLMKKAESNPDGSKYTFSKETCDWWRKKNKIKRHAYARLLYKTLSDYGSGNASISLAGAKMLYKLDMEEEELTEGILPGSIIETENVYGEIERRVNIRYAMVYEDKDKKNQAHQEYEDRKQEKTKDDIEGGDDSYNGWDSIDKNVRKKNQDKYDYPKYLRSIEIQVDANHYRKLHVYEFREEVYISGQWFLLFGNGEWTSDSDSDDENKGEGKKYPRLLVPNHLHLHVNFTEYTIMKEYGMHFMLYSEKTIKVKWWKKFIGLFIGLIMCFASYGSSCGFIQVIINWAISYVVSYILELVLSSIDSPLMRMIVQMGMAMVGMLVNIGFDITSLTSEAFLDLASNLSKIAFNTYQQMEAEKLAEQRKLEMEIEAGENIDEMISNYEENTKIPAEVVLATDKSVHYSFMDAHNPDVLYNKMEQMYNYDSLYDVEGSVELRKQVKNG